MLRTAALLICMALCSIRTPSQSAEISGAWKVDASDASAPTPTQASERPWVPWTPPGYDPGDVAVANQMFPFVGQNKQRLQWLDDHLRKRPLD
jgi:hypothetical protein